MIIPLTQSVVNSAIKDGSGNIIADTYQTKLIAGTGITITDNTIAVNGTLTDTKMTQAYSTSADSFPILMSATKGITSTASRGATTALVNNAIYVVPNTGTFYATNFSATGTISANSGTLGGNAILTSASTLDATKLNGTIPASCYTNTVTTATTSGSGNAVTAISATNGALTVTKGATFLTAHPTITTSSDTSGTATTLAHSGNFTAVTGVTRDANGHVTTIETTQFTLPASGNSDTKTSSSNKASTKLFLVGATAQSTSGQTTYTNVNVYVGTDNKLYSNGKVVLNSDDLASIYKVKGNITKLEAESVASNAYMKGKTSSAAGTSTALANGDVFNLTENASLKLNGATTAVTVPAGTNILWIADTGWDKLSSNFDLSGYLTSSSTLDATKLSGTIPDSCYTNTTYGAATSSALGLVKTSTGITNSSGTISVAYGTSATTACVGNDSRLSNARTPTAHASTATTYGASSATVYGHAMATSTTPKANGTAAVGTEAAKFARGDHVHPTDTTRQATILTATATIAVADWNTTNKTKAVTVTGVTATNTVCVSYAPASEAECAKANIKCTAQGANSLTFTYDTVPTASVSMNVLIIP